jgi:phenylacetic acid degradation operon negative regulatory protein
VAHPAVVKRLISDFSNRRPMRTTSLIVTFFGDVVSQHGNTIWLGSLVNAMAQLGINERLVRTSVFRLVKDGWLESERVGRRSFYRFTSYGSQEYQRAARRIYALESGQWKGQWKLLIPQDIPDKQREPFRRSLHWQGYRAIAAGTYARPGDSGYNLIETLEEFGMTDKVVVLDANTSALTSKQSLRKLVGDNWQLEDVAQGYQDFLARYKALQKWSRGKQPADPESAFIARVLLIHDYRRILLQDTPLPDELLPPAWPGDAARTLTGQVYKAVAQASNDYILTQLEPGNGPMPEADASFWSRFDRVN